MNSLAKKYDKTEAITVHLRRVTLGISSRWCELCGNQHWHHKHHLFPNTKTNRALYGKLIDDKKNLFKICESCHLSKPIPRWNEAEFCEALGIEKRGKA